MKHDLLVTHEITNLLTLEKEPIPYFVKISDVITRAFIKACEIALELGEDRIPVLTKKEEKFVYSIEEVDIIQIEECDYWL